MSADVSTILSAMLLVGLAIVPGATGGFGARSSAGVGSSNAQLVAGTVGGIGAQKPSAKGFTGATSTERAVPPIESADWMNWATANPKTTSSTVSIPTTASLQF